MSAEKCSLVRAVDNLKRLLESPASRQDKDWLKRMDGALETIEQATRRHRASLADAEGRVVDVDSSLNPSPIVARRTDELRHELDDLLREASALREKVRTVHPDSAADVSSAAGALPVAPEAAEVVDFGVFCERVEQLLRGFEHYDEEETDLIQESVTMDLGAGD